MYKIAIDPNKMRGKPFHTISSKLVWFSLLRDVSKEGFVHTSALGISKEIGVSEKTVRNVLRSFCENGLIEYESPILYPKKVRYIGCVIKLKSIEIYADSKAAKIRKKSDICSDIHSDKQQPIKQPIITAKTSSYNLSFVAPAFADAFTIWLDYKKKQFKFEYKTERSLKAAYAELVRLSGNDSDIAMRIVEQSMSNGWKGLFELKNNGTTNTRDTAASRKAQRDRGLSLANEIVSRSDNLLRLYNGVGTDPDTR